MSASAVTQRPSPLILTHGAIHRDATSGPVRALAIVAGEVVAAGAENEVWSAVGSDAPTIDLHGLTVLPGFTDAHLHWTNLALARRQVQLRHEMSLTEAVVEVREYCDRQPGEDWVLGRGWDHASWGRWPDASDLDRVESNRPVALIRKDGHAVWLNSAALSAAEISFDTPDPSGGEIARSDRAATGILKERAMELVVQVIPPATAVQRRTAIVEAWPEAWQLGITGCHDMGVLGGRPMYQDLTALRKAGDLGLRFVVYFRHQALHDAIELGHSSGIGDPWLRMGGLKLFMDGTLGSLTADMLSGFDSQPGYCGLPTLEYDEYRQLIGTAAQAGLATAVHCIGDAACRKALDGFQDLAPEQGAKRLQHRIEHAQLLDPAEVPRFRELGVVASMQPIHATADMSVANLHWGERTNQAYAWRSVLDGGAALAFGSDAPIETLDVFAGIHAAVTRQDPSGNPDGGWHPEQRVTVTEALRAYTFGPAYASGQASELGSLHAGRRADLVVLDRSPYDIPADELHSVRVVATMIDGKWVWHNPAADLTSRFGEGNYFSPTGRHGESNGGAGE